MRDVAQVPHLDQSKVLLKLCESKLVRRYVGSGIMVSKKCRYRSGFVGARRGAVTFVIPCSRKCENRVAKAGKYWICGQV
jgi:hypothetical protein